MLTIVAPIEDTPAFRAGLAAGDRILKIGEQFTKGMEIMEAVRLMRGAPGTDVTIAVMREGFERPKSFTLKREIIKIKSVKWKTLDDGFGYVADHPVPGTDRQRSGTWRSKVCAKRMAGRSRGWSSTCATIPAGCLSRRSKSPTCFLKKG